MRQADSILHFVYVQVFFGEREAGFEVSEVRPVDEVAHISPRAIMFVHGELDTAIPAANSRRLYAAAGEPKELYILPNAGHGGVIVIEPDDFERRVVAFLEAHLRSSDSQR